MALRWKVGSGALVLLAGLFATAWVGAAPAREKSPTCAYDPATKVVAFDFQGPAADYDPNTFDIAQPYLTRSGDRIVFKSAYNHELTCAGGVPTVHNTDRIDLTSSGDIDVLMTLVLAKGPLAPGATAEGPGSEIEIDSTIPDIEIEITPSDKPDSYAFGQTPEGPAANLNADEASPDPDILFHDLEPPRRHDDFIFSVAEYTGQLENGGADVVSAAGGDGFTGPFPYNVLLVGGTGDDQLTGGLGNDTLYGGRGRDDLRGGDGNDRLNSLGAQKDRVDCGSGTDLAQASDRDRVVNCERIAHTNRPAT
jgi:hypothetical protein